MSDKVELQNEVTLQNLPEFAFNSDEYNYEHHNINDKAVEIIKEYSLWRSTIIIGIFSDMQ